MRFFNAFVATPASPEGFTQSTSSVRSPSFIFAFDNNLHADRRPADHAHREQWTGAGPRIDCSGRAPTSASAS